MKFCLLAVGYIISLFIFQSGFLLKRRELHNRSSCRDARVDKSGCWMKESYKRVVLVVIDALRYDFLDPTNQDKALPYVGQMKWVSSVADQALIAPIEADPPTTTLQRLKGMMTGTLPTFIDASDNFSPDAQINEDNILDQLKSRGKDVSLLGDDTWLSLFPDRFYRHHALPSFDVFDLHTVDSAIIDYLPRELALNDSSVVIAHFLGVDHCGHRYGPTHPEMGAKLRELDRVLESVAKNLTGDDLLVVVGDHGMTSSGDHGGDSDAEIWAGLLMYSPGRVFPSPKRAFRQIDLVPTLSLLMGIPIPFSNLGTVIYEVFSEEQSTQAVQLNYEQIKRFVNTYSAANPSILSDGQLIVEGRDASSIEQQLLEMRHVQNGLRHAWTQFDLPLMVLGVFSLLECLLYNISEEPSSLTQWIVRSGTVFLQLSAYFGGSNNPAVPMLQFTLAMLILCHIAHIVGRMMSVDKINANLIASYVTVLVSVLVFFSNSFVVNEASIIRLLLQLLITISMAQRMLQFARNAPSRSSSSKMFRSLVYSETNSLLCLIFVRLEPLFHQCREEESQTCTQYFPTMLASELSTDTRVLRLLFGVISCVTLNYILTSKPKILSMHLTEINSSTRVFSALSWPVICAIVLNWASDLIPTATNTVKSVQMWSSWVVYAHFMLSIVDFVASLPRNRENRSLRIASGWLVFHSSANLLMLLLRHEMAPSLFALIFVVSSLPSIMDKDMLPAAYSLFLSHSFYALGHSPTLSAIPWRAAFLGVPGNFGLRAVPALLVLTHICASAVLVTVRASLLSTFADLVPRVLSMTVLRLIGSCTASFILRRHLMVWKIFCPRFVYEGISFIYLIGALSLTLLLNKAIHNK